MEEGIYEFRGPKEGKRILILGGTHGNEETGVAVVRLLREELATGNLISGVARLAIGNPKAVEEGRRFSAGGTDLNKLFRKEVLEGTDARYEAARARVLAPHIRDSDIVIDIHSTQQPTATAFISSKIDPAHEAVYSWFGEIAPLVIEDPDYVFAGEPASVDEYADIAGAVGICFETGYARETDKVAHVAECIRNVLRSNGILEGDVEKPLDARFRKYCWKESVPYEREKGWRWAPEITVQSFEFIPKGTVFGYAGDEPVSRPYDSFLLFPKTDELMQSEGRVGYLAIAVD